MYLHWCFITQLVHLQQRPSHPNGFLFGTKFYQRRGTRGGSTHGSHETLTNDQETISKRSVQRCELDGVNALRDAGLFCA